MSTSVTPEGRNLDIDDAENARAKEAQRRAAIMDDETYDDLDESMYEGHEKPPSVTEDPINRRQTVVIKDEPSAGIKFKDVPPREPKPRTERTITYIDEPNSFPAPEKKQPMSPIKIGLLCILAALIIGVLIFVIVLFARSYAQEPTPAQEKVILQTESDEQVLKEEQRIAESMSGIVRRYITGQESLKQAVQEAKSLTGLSLVSNDSISVGGQVADTTNAAATLYDILHQNELYNEKMAWEKEHKDDADAVLPAEYANVQYTGSESILAWFNTYAASRETRYGLWRAERERAADDVKLKYEIDEDTFMFRTKMKR